MLRLQMGEQPVSYLVTPITEPASQANTYSVITTDPRGEGDSTLVTQEHVFLGRIHQAGGGQLALVVLAGYSAAGYANRSFEQDLRNYMLRVENENAKLGLRTVFVSGATPEGIGAAYDVATAGAAKFGVVSGQAVKYGEFAKGQKGIYLFPSFKEGDGSRSWEVRGSAIDESFNSKMFSAVDARQAEFSLFEGGEIALTEAVEFLLRARLEFGKKFTLTLYVDPDYRPQNPRKDRGFRAAAMLATYLLQHPRLVPENLNVQILRPGQIAPTPLETFDPINEFRGRVGWIEERRKDSWEMFRWSSQRSRGSLFALSGEERSQLPRDEAGWDQWIKEIAAWEKVSSIVDSVARRTIARFRQWQEVDRQIQNGELDNLDFQADRQAELPRASIARLERKIRLLQLHLQIKRKLSDVPRSGRPFGACSQIAL